VLKREREPSLYGDEESGIPPDKLYSFEDSEEVLSWALYVYDVVSKLFKELTGLNVD
jgi:HEPN domain-containing protein